MGERSACPRCSAAVDSLCCMKGGELELLAVVHGKKQGVRDLRSSLGDLTRELLG